MKGQHNHAISLFNKAFNLNKNNVEAILNCTLLEWNLGETMDN